MLALEGAAHGIAVNAIAPIAATRMTEGILGELTRRFRCPPDLIERALGECGIQVSGFAADGAAWTAWVAACIVTVLGAAGYLRGESLDFHEDYSQLRRGAFPPRFR